MNTAEKKGKFGSVLRRYEMIDSTNDAAFEEAAAGAAEGTVIVAEGQQQGRGRQGRGWFSPPGLNLYCSIILKPSRARQEWMDLSWVIAAAVGETLAERGIGDLTIKYPNDLQAGSRKIAGILLENRQCGEATTAVVAGVGVNVNIKERDFPAHLADKMTSIREIAGRSADREELLQRLCVFLERYYALWSASGPAAVMAEACRHGISFVGFEKKCAALQRSD